MRSFVEAVALEPKKLLVDAGKVKVKGRDFLVSEGFETVSVRIDTLTIPRNSGTIYWFNDVRNKRFWDHLMNKMILIFSNLEK